MACPEFKERGENGECDAGDAADGSEHHGGGRDMLAGEWINYVTDTEEEERWDGYRHGCRCRRGDTYRIFFIQKET